MPGPEEGRRRLWSRDRKTRKRPLELVDHDLGERIKDNFGEVGKSNGIESRFNGRLF